MKFLAGLVHVAVASQIVFARHDPPAVDTPSSYVTDKLGEAAGFLSPTVANDACEGGRTVDHVTFWMDTSRVAPNTTLEVAICPSVEGVPGCTESTIFEQIDIFKSVKPEMITWTPASSIVLPPSTLHYFVVFSSADHLNQAPKWYDNADEDNSVNNPTHAYSNEFGRCVD
ncbi:hypothetical protein H310_11360 [Aphanomyces invadans]|uniref:Uncharacterized protein n=1 Tax=Aphanomyces invadans TaxID=157072 RepID=A0A024TN54_9STRA|nr:hypothetical protein H310_11360 [Aphanomyces invadans]ETV95066.1 hypothetical protein H310_11360 [Aphanomyces invadans]|eukprot:XP_008876239.1 hypothetical protein H310_11360 [Aphanomyces invadans]